MGAVLSRTALLDRFPPVRYAGCRTCVQAPDERPGWRVASHSGGAGTDGGTDAQPAPPPNPYLHGGYDVDGATTMLRTDVLTPRLLVERLHACGPMSIAAAIDALETRAPGRSREVIRHAEMRGLIRTIHRTDDEPAMLEAAGAPLSRAS